MPEKTYASRSLREATVTESGPGWFRSELVYVLRSRPERFWRWLVQWEDCRTFWGSHGCDKRRGHLGRHRCGGILRGRCGRGYDTPPWWAFWRADETVYFGEDVPGWEPQGSFTVYPNEFTDA